MSSGWLLKHSLLPDNILLIFVANAYLPKVLSKNDHTIINSKVLLYESCCFLIRTLIKCMCFFLCQITHLNVFGYKNNSWWSNPRPNCFRLLFHLYCFSPNCNWVPIKALILVFLLSMLHLQMNMNRKLFLFSNSGWPT